MTARHCVVLWWETQQNTKKYKLRVDTRCSSVRVCNFYSYDFFSLFCCALSSNGSKAPRCSLSGRNYFFNGCKSLFFPVSLTLLGTETMDQEQVEIYFCVFILKSAEPFDMTFSAAAAAQTCEKSRGDFMMRKVLMCAMRARNVISTLQIRYMWSRNWATIKIKRVSLFLQDSDRERSLRNYEIPLRTFSPCALAQPAN